MRVDLLHSDGQSSFARATFTQLSARHKQASITCHDVDVVVISVLEIQTSRHRHIAARRMDCKRVVHRREAVIHFAVYRYIRVGGRYSRDTRVQLGVLGYECAVVTFSEYRAEIICIENLNVHCGVRRTVTPAIASLRSNRQLVLLRALAV